MPIIVGGAAEERRNDPLGCTVKGGGQVCKLIPLPADLHLLLTAMEVCISHLSLQSSLQYVLLLTFLFFSWFVSVMHNGAACLYCFMTH